MIRRDDRPLIAVVGSLEPAREYRPALRGDNDEARAACRELGAALARSGYDLALFSSKPHYIESVVAAGYAEASTAGRPGRIVASTAQHQDFTLDLPPGVHLELRTIRGTNSEWEVSFYRTLYQVDGLVLVGGGQSTRVAGIIALAQGIPVVPLATFGGSAGQVWTYLDREGGRASSEDIALLGAPWSDTSAGDLMGYLDRQIRRRDDDRAAADRAVRRAARTSAQGRAVAAVALTASLASIAVVGGPAPAGTRSLSLLLLAPMLAAAAGAIIWDSFAPDQHWGRAAVRGFGAGVVTVLLYVASQLLATPDLLDLLDARRLLFFVVPLGFVAGLSFDLVFHRLRSAPDLPGTDLALLRPGTPPDNASQ